MERQSEEDLDPAVLNNVAEMLRRSSAELLIEGTPTQLTALHWCHRPQFYGGRLELMADCPLPRESASLNSKLRKDNRYAV
jgi:hypothetical protein